MFWQFKLHRIQGCALAEPGGPWHPTFALRWLENLKFFIQIICWAPKVSEVKSTGLPLIFLRAQPWNWHPYLAGELHLRPRPHVSGDFCIRKFFYADTKISASTHSVYESYTTVHTYPIRIRTSQRISQQSMRIKTGSDTVTSAYTKIYAYERPHVSGYTAYREISTLESVYRNLQIHRAYTADMCGR